MVSTIAGFFSLDEVTAVLIYISSTSTVGSVICKIKWQNRVAYRILEIYCFPLKLFLTQSVGLFLKSYWLFYRRNLEDFQHMCYKG